MNKVLRVNVGHFMACTTFAVRSWGGQEKKGAWAANKKVSLQLGSINISTICSGCSS